MFMLTDQTRHMCVRTYRASRMRVSTNNRGPMIHDSFLRGKHVCSCSACDGGRQCSWDSRDYLPGGKFAKFSNVVVWGGTFCTPEGPLVNLAAIQRLDTCRRFLSTLRPADYIRKRLPELATRSDTVGVHVRLVSGG